MTEGRTVGLARDIFGLDFSSALTLNTSYQQRATKNEAKEGCSHQNLGKMD